jgi:hypothetical protein
MDIRQEIILLLQEAGYRIRENFDGMSSLYFEDSTIIGFASIEASYSDIVANWKGRQDEFLRSNAKRLRNAPLKAWNAYSIFLSPSLCSDEEQGNLYLIEEDFQGTRKIARGDILTRDDVERALYPILPVRNIAPLQLGDPLERLWSKLNLSEHVRDAFLGGATPEDLADLLTVESK